ncbi:MAG: hypothetical protein IJF26_05560 [Clostridia bacterium]|nr:hypothetical protein [Clostridia bacterium]
MKKLILILLPICICISAVVVIAVCRHQHTYKEEWTYDETHHWHECDDDDCTEVSDKAEHTWNNGEITTEATAEADGVKTFTCTVCAKTKTEAVKHTHTYKTEWSHNDTHHWHACEDATCTEASDKAEHTWNDGEITTEATAEADGVKTFTCTVCAKTKTEAVIFSGVSKEEWDALANIDNYKNYTVTTTQIDIFFKSVSTTKIVDGYAYVSGTIYDLETNEVVGNQNGSMKLTDAYYKSLLPIVNNYDKVEYDRENDVYRYTEDFQVSMDEDGSLMLTYTEFEWTLKDGKIWKTQSKAWYMDDTSGRVDLSLTQEYTNYGTTVAPEE